MIPACVKALSAGGPDRACLAVELHAAASARTCLLGRCQGLRNRAPAQADLQEDKGVDYCIQGVRGSNPLSSTNVYDRQNCVRDVARRTVNLQWLPI